MQIMNNDFAEPRRTLACILHFAMRIGQNIYYNQKPNTRNVAGPMEANRAASDNTIYYILCAALTERWRCDPRLGLFLPLFSTDFLVATSLL